MVSVKSKITDDGKVVGYVIEINGTNYKLNVPEALNAVRAAHNASNALIVTDSYLRLKHGRLSEEPVTQQKDVNIVDVSNWRIVPTAVSGLQGKLLLEHAGTKYMLKLPSHRQDGVEIPTHISEFVACKITKSLGYSVQEVWLANFKGLRGVLVRMFDRQLVHFTGFGSSTLSEGKLNYDLDGLLQQLGGSLKFDATLARYVYSTFLVDSFICNLDRHPNNWGFFEQNGRYVPAPLIDMGNSLFSISAGRLGDRRQIERSIEQYGKSAVLYKGQKSSFRAIIRTAHNPHLQAAVFDLKSYLPRLSLTCLESVVRFDPNYRKYAHEIEQFVAIQKGWFGAL